MAKAKRRYSGHDKHFGPFTLSKHNNLGWRPLGLMLDSGGDHEDSENTGCNLKLHGFGRTLIVELPRLLPDYRIKHVPTTWDAATIARLGRDHYFEVFPCEYGFTFSDKTLHVHYGPQTHDSITTKNKVFFLPWLNWEYRGINFYGLDGRLFETLTQACEIQLRKESWEKSFDHRERLMARVPKVAFEIEDFDGERIVCTTHIEERYYTFGTGRFQWLSWFVKPKAYKSLALEFDKEVGPEKGSWKGGLRGTGIDILPGELHEAAFRRYCEQEHRDKGGRYRIKFIGAKG